MNWSEDTVREHAIEYLVSQLGKQRKDIRTEIPIKMGSSKNKRADIVVFEPNKPQTVDNIDLIIECKAASGSRDEDAIEQLKSYLYATSAETGYVVRQVRDKAKLNWIPFELESDIRKRKFKQGKLFTSTVSLGAEKQPVISKATAPVDLRFSDNQLDSLSEHQEHLLGLPKREVVQKVLPELPDDKLIGRRIFSAMGVMLWAIFYFVLCVVSLLAAVWIDMFYVNTN